MIRIAHGTVVPLETDEHFSSATNATTSNLALKRSWPFDYMFQELQADDEARLETSAKTVEDLCRLGKVMGEETTESKPGVNMPAIYTFFGQFVDHDITLEMGSSKISLANPSPITLDQIPGNIVNSRSPDLDLDSVYVPDIDGEFAPRNGDTDELRLASVAGSDEPPRRDTLHDLPRRDNGSAMIGDRRNDENIVTSQLHVAFMRAHNKLVEKLTFEDASKKLRQHYQWIVLHDFLRRIADPIIVKNVRFRAPKFFTPKPQSFFMPLEFSAAVYRFGHSKVRASYDMFNRHNPGGGLDLLFSRARQPLTVGWVIDWTHFLRPELGFNLPRPIDTTLTKLLLELRPAQLADPDPEGNLAIRNLLRGYILRMPTGQAVANAMASDGIRPMTAYQILSVAAESQREVLIESGFLTKTPLWFYILAEAAYYSRGYHLGPVGSTIVAEVLIEVLRKSTDSILSEPDWRPTLGETPGKFDLEDLLKLAGVF